MKRIKKVVASHIVSLCRQERRLSLRLSSLTTYQRAVSEIAEYMLNLYGDIAKWDDLADLTAWAYLRWCDEKGRDFEDMSQYIYFVHDLRKDVAIRFVKQLNIDVEWDFV